MMRLDQRTSLPIFLFIGGGLLLIFAGFVFAIQNASSAATNVASHEEATYPEIARVSLSDAKAAFDSRQALFVDARPADSYSQKHIVGAINIPLSQLEARIGELDPNEWIVTYCT